MRKMIVCFIVAALVMASSSMALATAFYAVSNELGYQGTIWNITDGSGPWTTAVPRDATLFTTVSAPQVWSDYNMLATNWSEHAQSNTSNSFFQIAENGNASVTSANAYWSPDLLTFNMSLSGANLPYSTGYSRFWQPDKNTAGSVRFIDYSYLLTATFLTPAVLDSNGFYVNSSSPNAIDGSFTGRFVVPDGDIYGFNMDLSKALLAPLDPTNGYDGSAVFANSEFGATAVPEPATLLLLGGGLTGLAVWRRKKRD